MRRFQSLLGVALALSGQLAHGHPQVDKATVFSDAKDIADSYDYIIIGGGTSGLTVADRLTEDGKTTVLVVEYGEISTHLQNPRWNCTLG